MIEYITMEDETGTIKLIVGYDYEKNSTYMPSIEFTQLKEKGYPDLNLMFDNNEYIFNRFKKFIKHYIKKVSSGENLKKKYKEDPDLSQVISILSLDKAKDVLLMLEQAESQGWYKRENVEQS